MRRTLFFYTRDMIPIIYAATYKLYEKYVEKYMEFYKISLSEYQEISNKIINILRGRELSAPEIRKELDSKSNIPTIINLICNDGTKTRK